MLFLRERNSSPTKFFFLRKIVGLLGLIGLLSQCSQTSNLRRQDSEIEIENSENQNENIIDSRETVIAAQTNFYSAIETGFAASEELGQTLESAFFRAITVRTTALSVSSQVPVYFSWRETINEENSLSSVSTEFSLSIRQLATLNEDLDLNNLAPNEEILVAQFDPTDPSRSHGRPNRGRLINGVPMPDGPYWIVRHRNEAYGTWYTLVHLVRGYSLVGEHFPHTDPILIGDLSNRRGRRMRPHRSHQSGRDVDITYFLTEDVELSDRFIRASRDTLDYERQWALFSYWITLDVVTYIFMDRRLQRALYRWAIANGVDKNYLSRALEASPISDHPVIRHARGHADHFHVRFKCNYQTDIRCSE